MKHPKVIIHCDNSLPYKVVLVTGSHMQIIPVKNCSLNWVKRKMLEMFPKSTIAIRGEGRSE